MGERSQECESGVVVRVANAAKAFRREKWSSRDHGEQQAAEGQSAMPMRWDARVGCAVKPPGERGAGEWMRDGLVSARWLQSRWVAATVQQGKTV